MVDTAGETVGLDDDIVVFTMLYPYVTTAGPGILGAGTTFVDGGITVGAAGTVGVVGALNTAVNSGVAETGWGVSAVGVTGAGSTDTF